MLFLLFANNFRQVISEEDLSNCLPGFFREKDSICRNCSVFCSSLMTNIDIQKTCNVSCNKISTTPISNYVNNTGTDYSKENKIDFEISTAIQNNVTNTDYSKNFGVIFIVIGAVFLLLIIFMIILIFIIYKKKCSKTSTRSPGLINQNNECNGRKADQSTDSESLLCSNPIINNNSDSVIKNNIIKICGNLPSRETSVSYSKNNSNGYTTFTNIRNKPIQQTDMNSSKIIEMKERSNDDNSSIDVQIEKFGKSSSRATSVPDLTNYSNDHEVRTDLDFLTHTNSSNSFINTSKSIKINERSNNDSSSINMESESGSSNMYCGQLTKTLHYQNRE